MYFSEEGQKPRIRATVLDNREIVMGRNTDDERTIYTPILEYEIDSEVYTTKSGVKARSSPYRVGEQVEVRYDPSEPDSIYQSNVSRLYATALIISLTGITGLMLLVQTIKRMRDIHQGPNTLV